MRAANKATTRTQYPIPTIEDLLINLKDFKHFTKLDLNFAFHQLEDPECRYITAFKTEGELCNIKD